MRTCRFRARRRRDAIERNCRGSHHAGGGNDRKADCRASRRAIVKIFCGQKKLRPNFAAERNHIGGTMDDTTNVALLAWEILGAIVALIIIIVVIAMIPEMRRYFRLKNM